MAKEIGVFGGTPLVTALIKRDKILKSVKRDEALLKLKDGVSTIKQPSEAAKLTTGAALSVLVRTLV